MFARQRYALRLSIDQLSIRERVLLLSIIISAILLLTQGLLMLTHLNDQVEINSRINTKKAELAQIQTTLDNLELAANNPRIVSLTNSNADLQERIQRIEENLATIDSQLMSPDRMVELLRELLAEQQNLALVEFDLLPVEPIESNLDGGELFYQHSLALTLEGEFEALTGYLASIESLPTQLFWNRLNILTDDFPTLRIELHVHTLSRQEAWLNV